MATFAFSGILVLVFAFVMLGLLVAGLVKLLSSPQSRQAVKTLILVPLLLVGVAVLAFVVLTGYRVARVERPPMAAIRVDDGVKKTQVSISSNGIKVETAHPTAPASQLRQPGSGDGPSGVVKAFRAMNTAFVTALRTTFEKSPPVAQGSPQSPKGNPLAVRSESAPNPAAPAAPAVASSSGAKPAVAASPSPASAAAPTASKRPNWVDNPPQPTADVYEVAVKAGPWKTRLECEQSLDEEIDWAVDSYVDWRIGKEASSQVALPADYSRRHLVKDQWLEKIDTSLGEMFNLHALLSFDRQVEGKLRDTWTGVLLGARLILSSAILGGVLLLLTTIYGYLKIDLSTGGAYRGWLRFAAAAILALVAAGAAFSLS